MRLLGGHCVHAGRIDDPGSAAVRATPVEMRPAWTQCPPACVPRFTDRDHRRKEGVHVALINATRTDADPGPRAETSFKPKRDVPRKRPGDAATTAAQGLC